MSEVIDIDDRSEFHDLLDTEDTLVVKFWATWCGPCKQLAPHYEEAADRSEATFVAVDVDKADWSTVDYGIRSVPTVKLFRKGEYVTDLKGTTVIRLLKEISDH